MPHEMILTETQGRVAVIRLNRPQALNALCDQLMGELGQALRDHDRDPAIAAIVITGSEKAFAAGADIKEMKDRRFPATYMDDKFAEWDRIGQRNKPIIAAVAGFALGGGCELAMMCDFVIAADNARFGQPEINLGVMPGAGGTQRMTKAIGKAKTMDLCLTGRMMDAAEAERSGLVARVVPLADLMGETMKAAAQIAEKSQVATRMTKETVNRAFETTLAEGLRFERRLFSAMFATADQKEGMKAFAEKRKPAFRNK